MGPPLKSRAEGTFQGNPVGIGSFMGRSGAVRGGTHGAANLRGVATSARGRGVRGVRGGHGGGRRLIGMREARGWFGGCRDDVETFRQSPSDQGGEAGIAVVALGKGRVFQ